MTDVLEDLLDFSEHLFRFYAGQAAYIFEATLALTMTTAGATSERRVVNADVCSVGGKPKEWVC